MSLFSCSIKVNNIIFFVRTFLPYVLFYFMTSTTTLLRNKVSAHKRKTYKKFAVILNAYDTSICLNPYPPPSTPGHITTLSPLHSRLQRFWHLQCIIDVGYGTDRALPTACSSLCLIISLNSHQISEVSTCFPYMVSSQFDKPCIPQSFRLIYLQSGVLNTCWYMYMFRGKRKDITCFLITHSIILKSFLHVFSKSEDLRIHYELYMPE